MTTMNIYDMADEWNNAETTFTAIKMDVTDTASASDSLLMDLRVGGASKFSVDKNGIVTSANGVLLSNMEDTWDNAGTSYRAIKMAVTDSASASDSLLLELVYNSVAYFTLNKFGFARVRNGLDIGNSVGGIRPVSGVMYIEDIGTTIGGGSSFIRGRTGQSLVLGVQNSGRWEIPQTSFSFQAVVDDAYDIGASGANRPRNVYIAGYIEVSGLPTSDPSVAGRMWVDAGAGNVVKVSAG